MTDQNAMTKYGTRLKTVKSYLLGLVLSLIFTCASFLLVGKHLLKDSSLYIAITIFAIAQLIAQVACFLRMTATKDGRWNTMPFLFTILIVAVLVFGSLWIMYNLNYNMVH
ncbi:MAG: cytochrome o ubiquinol oxidase subunit IV [Gammaproteobacteria bacterium]|nr:cytochrome o ubiquinol oxidase subunit IV [Gammaproteobacteria bacterium]MCH9743809.1 cytochrome o ubiquinol oxidase subunit IV [Gammaproteobacteria bacterium]